MGTFCIASLLNDTEQGTYPTEQGIAIPEFL